MLEVPGQIRILPPQPLKTPILIKNRCFSAFFGKVEKTYSMQNSTKVQLGGISIVHGFDDRRVSLLRLVENMTVNVFGRARLAVPHGGCDRNGIHPGEDERGDIAVPESVGVEVREFVLLLDFL